MKYYKSTKIYLKPNQFNAIKISTSQTFYQNISYHHGTFVAKATIPTGRSIKGNSNRSNYNNPYIIRIQKRYFLTLGLSPFFTKEEQTDNGYTLQLTDASVSTDYGTREKKVSVRLDKKQSILKKLITPTSIKATFANNIPLTSMACKLRKSKQRF